MTAAKVTGIRSIELGVRDLQQSANFYTNVWALEEIASEADSLHFRATGGEHHVLTIRQCGKPSLLGVHFAARDREIALRRHDDVVREPGWHCEREVIRAS